jgi:putative phage-type endonuclease
MQHIHTDDLIKQILTYLEKYKHLPMQHTKEWLEFKKYTIGGSQIATIMGLNAFETLGSLTDKKLGASKKEPPSTMIKMWWGNLFEPLVKAYLEYSFDTTIYGDEMMVVSNEYKDVSYSPDGLAVIEGKITLLEFKCPYNRLPYGQIPKYYLPQVKMGMDMIPICNCALFSEAVFRKCRWGDIANTVAYDRSLDQGLVKGSRFPLALGFIGIYDDGKIGDAIKPPSTYERVNGELIKVVPKEVDIETEGVLSGMIDYGKCGRNDFVDIMEMISGSNKSVGKRIKTWYSDLVVDEPCPQASLTDDLNEFLDYCQINKYRAVGVIPWKLFSVDNRHVDKTPGYLKPFQEKISEVINMVRKKEEDRRNGVVTLPDDRVIIDG